MQKGWTIIVLVLLTLFGTDGFAQQGAYRIGPGDILEISVWKDESLSKQVIVPPDGMLSFPLVEDIDIKDLTVPQLRTLIAGKLSEFIPEPTVTVMLLKADSMRAYVIGKVNNPGVFPIGEGTTVMQILAMAGGLNPFAAANRISILRKTEGGTVRLPFEYARVEKGENVEQNIELKRGDVIVVP